MYMLCMKLLKLSDAMKVLFFRYVITNVHSSLTYLEHGAQRGPCGPPVPSAYVV